MLERYLDDSHSAEIHDHITRLTIARFTSNTALRFAIPFLGVIRQSLGVSLSTMGLAASMGDFTGLLGPFIGHRLDRRSRRTTMVLGLASVALGAGIAAASTSVLVLTIGFVVIGLSKMVFDNGMNSWLTERTTYANRGRVMGLAETAWAAATLLGIPILAVVAWLTSWRIGYVVLVAVLLGGAVQLWRGLPADQPAPHAVGGGRLVWTRAGLAGFGTFACMMATGTCMFVAFGSWLKDTWGLSTLGLGAVSMLLGGAELLASTSTVRFTDRWGKRRSVRYGIMLMAPAALGLALSGRLLVLGLLVLVLFFLGFEFAIVSFIPLIPSLQPHNAGAAFGLAVGLGTAARAVAAIVSTRLYTGHGMQGSGFLALGCALAAFALLTQVREPA